MKNPGKTECLAINDDNCKPTNSQENGLSLSLSQIVAVSLFSWFHQVTSEVAMSWKEFLPQIAFNN